MVEAPTDQVRAGEITAATLRRLRDAAAPGIDGLALDRLAESTIREAGGVPAFKGYRGFPGSVCLSINDQVVHGIPGPRTLAVGDLVSFDVGVKVGEHFADAAITVVVGDGSAEAERLRVTAEGALGVAIDHARPGMTTGDLGAAVEAFVKDAGFAVVRDCVGHGIGTKLHEDPSIPNFGKAGKGSRFSAGKALAIEPMIVAGDARLSLDEDQWTLATEDGGLAAHAEETVFVTDDGPLRLTPVTEGLSQKKVADRLEKATQTDESR